ncbi:MAG: OmpW family protein [Steroidobacterales bacterium]
MTKFALRALPVALLSLTASLACADPIPDNTVRLGEYWVFYHATASDLSGPFIPPGEDLNVSVKNVQTPYVAYLRQLSTHFTVELAFGVPPLTKTYGKGPATLAGTVPYNGQELSSARWVAPTLLIEYVFFDESYALRPYIGAGVNYTGFIDRNSTPAGDAASGGPTRIELPSSVGPAGTVGLTYRLPHNWSLMASYSVTRVTTHLSAITAGVVRTTDISFGPQAFVAAVGYSF